MIISGQIKKLLTSPDNGSSVVGAVEVDEETGEILRVKEVCTRPDCSCEGAWWNEWGGRPYGRTKTFYRSKVLKEALAKT